MNSRLATTLSRFAVLGLLALAGCAADSDDLGADLGTTDDEVRSGRVVIHFDPHQRIHYGYDIKQDGRAAFLNNTRAQEIFGEDQFDLIRIPVFAFRAHPGPDRVQAGEYESIVNAVHRAQAVSPGVKVFASLRLDDPASFPGWVMNAGHIQPDNYAHLLMDFLQFMNTQGIHVDYLGPDNESIFNHGDTTPARFADIVQSLAQRCRNASMHLPEIVGNDEYSPAIGDRWIDGLAAQNHMGLLDVAGVHYYSKHRTADYRRTLSQWASSARGRPIWDTEFHWNDDTGGGEFYDAKLGIMAAFDNTDLGVDNITWWAYNPRSNGTLTAYLHSAFVRATVHAQPLTTIDHDGAPLAEHRFNSRAFSQGNDVNLVVVNDTDNNYGNRLVEIQGHQFDHAVTFQRWTRSGGAAGSSGSAERYPEGGVFRMDFPAQSITVVHIPNVR